MTTKEQMETKLRDVLDEIDDAFHKAVFICYPERVMNHESFQDIREDNEYLNIELAFTAFWMVLMVRKYLPDGDPDELINKCLSLLGMSDDLTADTGLVPKNEIDKTG